MTDEQLAAVLDGEAPEWRQVSALVRLETKLRTIGRGSKRAQELTDKLLPLIERWWNEPLKEKMVWVGQMGSTLNSGWLSGWALDVAAERDGTAAVAWLQKLLTTEETDGRLVVSLTGVNIEEPREFEDGFRVEPRSDAHRWQALDRHVLIGGVCSLPVKGAPMIRRADEKRSGQVFEPVHRAIRSHLVGLALTGAAPRMFEWWFQYDDPDFERLRRDGSRSFTLDQQAHFWGPKLDLDDAQKQLTFYLNLTGQVQKSVTLALERLVSARVELNAGDKAIDGAIAMEALFLADGNPELKYRLRVRAARFLGTSLAERVTISTAISKFYDLRSAIVHGSKASSEIEDAQGIIEQGLGYVQSAARHICESGKMPDWRALELE